MDKDIFVHPNEMGEISIMSIQLKGVYKNLTKIIMETDGNIKFELGTVKYAIEYARV